MRLIILSLIIIVVVQVFPQSVRSDEPYGNLQLLDGFKYKRSSSFDAINGLIYKQGGLTIEFESGVSQGYAADPREKGNFIWFREQQLGKHKVFVALTRLGIGTKWEPRQKRNRPGSKVLIVTFPGTFGPLDAANFYGEVADDTELSEMLLMVLTFDPSR